MLKVQTFIHRIGCVLVLLSSSIIDWNNPLIINKMYKVYLGDVPLKTKVCKLNSSFSNLILLKKYEVYTVYYTVLYVH